MWVSSCPCPAVDTVFFGASGRLEVGNSEGESESLKCVHVYVKQTVASSLESFDIILLAC